MNGKINKIIKTKEEIKKHQIEIGAVADGIVGFETIQKNIERFKKKMTREEAIEILNETQVVYFAPNGKAKVHEALTLAIEALSAEVEWIPCSDRLPREKDGQVLVTKHGEVRIATYSEYSGTWYAGEMCAVGGEDPIAWMLLPKPYREDREDYELATEQMEHDAMYEPTYNPEDGSM